VAFAIKVTLFRFISTFRDERSLFSYMRKMTLSFTNQLCSVGDF